MERIGRRIRVSEQETPEPDGSPTLSPNDHLRLLIELMRPAGAELARRWLAALMIVPPDEREDVVGAIEARIVETYGDGGGTPAREDQDD